MHLWQVTLSGTVRRQVDRASPRCAGYSSAGQRQHLASLADSGASCENRQAHIKNAVLANPSYRRVRLQEGDEGHEAGACFQILYAAAPGADLQLTSAGQLISSRSNRSLHAVHT
jgi:uncharacterized protein YijF (DUF1287 family)